MFSFHSRDTDSTAMPPLLLHRCPHSVTPHNSTSRYTTQQLFMVSSFVSPNSSTSADFYVILLGHVSQHNLGNNIMFVTF